MTQRTTRIKAVNHATFSWRNQFGMVIAKKPRKPTVHGVLIETLKSECRERAMKCQDIWTPVVRLYLSMARVIRYEGKRAVEIWRTYCAEVYGSNKRKAKA